MGSHQALWALPQALIPTLVPQHPTMRLGEVKMFCGTVPKQWNDLLTILGTSVGFFASVWLMMFGFLGTSQLSMEKAFLI